MFLIETLKTIFWGREDAWNFRRSKGEARETEKLKNHCSSLGTSGGLL
jgi:hypothetical protein